jgi:hypothetical protein
MGDIPAGHFCLRRDTYFCPYVSLGITGGSAADVRVEYFFPAANQADGGGFLDFHYGWK